MERLAREGRLDLGTVFDRLPTAFMVLDRDLVYVGLNQAYLDVTQRTRESIIGRHIFEAFPEEGENRRQLEESLERALESGRTDYIPFLKYAIPRPDGEFETRVWSVTHTPIPGKDGRPEFIVQHTQDISGFLEWGEGKLPPGAGKVGQDILRRAESVQAQTEEMRRLFGAAPGFMAILRAPDFVIEWANDACYDLLGNRDLVGLPMENALPELQGQGFRVLLEQVMTDGEPYVGHRESVNLQNEQSGPLIEHLLDFVFQPISDPDGTVTGVFVQGQDVTEAARAEEQQRLLLDELNHRVKNTLATVQAIAAQTLRAGRPAEDFAKDFQARLMALSHTHDALTSGRWHGVELQVMLMAELGPYADGQMDLEGPAITLSPTIAPPFGMVIHELATNAAKYGALSRRSGRLKVAWWKDDGNLHFEWSETGGPDVLPPTRRGFGTRLIERTLNGELNGEAKMDFKPEGLQCSMRIPLQDMKK